MTDFEERLSEALRSAGDDAPEAVGLASAAHSRAGARRRRTALTSVAAVVAVAGVVGGAALLGNRDGGRTATPATDGPTLTVSKTPHAPEASDRVESWRDLSVTVPAEWGYGALDDWCGGGGELGSPVVERPGASIDILCQPENGYGVEFFDASLFDAAYPPGEPYQLDGGSVYPDGAWIGYQRDASGNNGVMVVTRDREATQAVLDSFVRITDVDANGCTAHAGDTGPAVDAGSVRLCRYGVDDWLEQSEVLTGQDAADAVAALESAPAKGDRMCTMALTGPRIRVTTPDGEGWVTLDACHGFAWVDGEHDLTADVLYWVLSPGWSGGVEGDVPMPSKFRQ